MTPEQFRQIEDLYHAAREGTPEERAAILARTDPELRREVELLLSEASGGEFLDRLAIENEPLLLADLTRTQLAVGENLGPYRIEAKLGEGGMGEVFRAVDTRLGRAVAIKTTHQQFSGRFEREARAISSLNHPNVCTLHDVGPNYLVMELVEGDTIAERLKARPLPLKTALLYASQILAALVEAHGKGVIHRDLKPANIMIAKSGIKVLDFGLAKSGLDETLTASRMILGTPAYMAPEQRAGKPADVRSDIYSFGCVLYEMFTGGRMGALRKTMPSRRLEKIVNRCLEEDPGRRWQSAAELKRELDLVAAGSIPWKAVAASLAIVAVFASGYAWLHRASKLTDEDTIVLSDFDNKTGDAVFDDTLRQALSVALQQTPFLAFLPDARIRQTLNLMGRPANARLTAEIALQVCERTGSTVVLEGSIASLGSQYVLGLHAKNCHTGNTLDQEQIITAKREDVLNSLSQIASKLRIRLGESMATVERHSRPLAEVTTSSLEALKAYSAGMKMIGTRGGGDISSFMQRAVEIDPKFAMPYAMLGVYYSGNGLSELSTEVTTKAWLLRDRVSERERFFIDFAYDRDVTGNLEKAYQTLESWYQAYPRGENPNAQGFLTGLATHGTGRYERAIELGQKGLLEHPEEAVRSGSLASSYFLLGRFDEAESTLQRSFERKLENENQVVMRYNIALLKGDQDQADRVAAWAKGKPVAEHRLAHAEALALARSGRIRAARRSSNRAVDLATQEGKRETAASYQAARAVWEAAYGNDVEGRKMAMAALAVSKGRDVEYMAALALALSGDFSQSEAHARGLEKRLPEDTFVKFTYVPVLRALAEERRSRPAEAVERLQIALRYELAGNGLNFNHWFLFGLHSAYVRGEALIAEQRYPEAAAELQKILDHRGIVGLDPIGALVHLQLGKMYALSADNTRAKAEYDAFLKLWKEADSDTPVLKTTKAEYAKLQ